MRLGAGYQYKIKVIKKKKSTRLNNLELCHHGSLGDLLDRRGVLTEPEVQCYALQILDALEYLHSERVVHRDIKPDNIFLQKGLRTRIGDFGLSLKLDDTKECIL